MENLEKLKDYIDYWLGTKSIIEDGYILVPDYINKYKLPIIIYNFMQTEYTEDLETILNKLNNLDILEKYNGKDYFAIYIN